MAEPHAVIFDFKQNRITKRSLNADYGLGSDIDDKLYLVDDDLYYDANGGSTVQQTYKSPKIFGNNYDILKKFREFTVDCTLAFTYSVWLDDTLVLDSKVKTGTGIRDVGIPSRDAYTVQLEIKSLGTIRSISIEYEEIKS